MVVLVLMLMTRRREVGPTEDTSMFRRYSQEEEFQVGWFYFAAFWFFGFLGHTCTLMLTAQKQNNNKYYSRETRLGDCAGSTLSPRLARGSTW